MKKFAVSFVALMMGVAGSSFAAVNDIKVSGSVDTHAVSRNLDLGSKGTVGGTEVKDAESFVGAVTKLGFDADLTENVAAKIQLVNERYWGQAEDAGNTDLDINLSYVQFSKMFDMPLTATLGRQNLVLGRGLILSNTGDGVGYGALGSSVAPNLTPRNGLDGINLVYAATDALSIDAFYFNAGENSLNVKDDQTHAGINATYTFADETLVEGYAVHSRLNTDGNDTQSKGDYLTTYGARAQGLVGDSFLVFGEGAYQAGDGAAAPAGRRAAYMIDLGGELRLNKEKNAKIGAEYQYTSGNKADSGDTNEGWNELLETYSWGETADYFVDGGNVQGIKLTGTYNIREDMTLSALYSYMAKVVNDGTTQLTGWNGNQYDMTNAVSDKDLGQGLDLAVNYAYTEDVNFGLVNSYFFPGQAFTNNNDETASSLRAYATVNF
jgi:hypothetical protein